MTDLHHFSFLASLVMFKHAARISKFSSQSSTDWASGLNSSSFSIFVSPLPPMLFQLRLLCDEEATKTQSSDQRRMNTSVVKVILILFQISNRVYKIINNHYKSYQWTSLMEGHKTIIIIIIIIIRINSI